MAQKPIESKYNMIANVEKKPDNVPFHDMIDFL